MGGPYASPLEADGSVSTRSDDEPLFSKCRVLNWWRNTETLARRHEKTIELMRYMTALLDEHGIEYWYSAGGVLSLLRHGSLILPWDDDADFEVNGVYDKDVMALVDRVKADGHTLRIGDFGSNSGLRTPRIAKIFWGTFPDDCIPRTDARCYGFEGPAHVDFFFVDHGLQTPTDPYFRIYTPNRRGDVMWTRNSGSYHFLPTEPVFPIERLCDIPEMDGLCLAVPRDRERMVDYRYGGDWMKPKIFNKFGKCAFAKEDDVWQPSQVNSAYREEIFRFVVLNDVTDDDSEEDVRRRAYALRRPSPYFSRIVPPEWAHVNSDNDLSMEMGTVFDQPPSEYVADEDDG